jgi:hypothetical protein
MEAATSASTPQLLVGRRPTIRRGSSARGGLSDAGGSRNTSNANDMDDEALDEIRRYETVSGIRVYNLEMYAYLVLSTLVLDSRLDR